MREIKFKFFDTLMNEWNPDRMFIMSNKEIVADCADRELVDVPDYDRFIPCQYIGLLDKYGNEIYEGDIVTLKHIKEYDGYIDYENGAFCLRQGTVTHCRVFSEYFAANSEVVGNIHENPELLP